MGTHYCEAWIARVSALLCGASLLLSMPGQSQQLTPPQPIATAALDTMAFLDHTLLQQDAALQVKISLEAKRMPLRELLAEAQKQSGITVRFTPDSPATRALMTARLKDMTLATLMSSLMRIYDVRWSKDGAAYTMHSSGNDELTYRLIRYKGLNGTEAYAEDREISYRQDDALAKDIFHSIDKKRWDDQDTVLVSSLPEVMQERLRLRFELVGLQREVTLELRERLFARLIPNLHLRLHIAAEKTPTLQLYSRGKAEMGRSNRYQMARLMAYTPDGRFVSALFPDFHGPKQAPPPPRPEDARSLDGAEAPPINNILVAPRR
ncbi:MAG: hypothetical protein JWN98_1951 [Abditibacteriota bacterium]|nr:hypothetical protein [Abditibacteriota bacterium]